MGNNISIQKFKLLLTKQKEDIVVKNGRKYHVGGKGKYILPVDGEELDRQQFIHFNYKQLFGGSFSAPVENLLNSKCKVLDVGCGSGVWLLELATEYKKPKFFGIDLVSVFPAETKPTNAEFSQHNILYGLPYDSDTFDYVHLGIMSIAFTENQWTNIVIPELIRVLKPGGWIEFFEFDNNGFSNTGPQLTKLLKTLTRYLTKYNLNPDTTALIKPWLQSYSCLTNLEEIKKTMPIGAYGGDVGALNVEIAKEFFIGTVMPIFKDLMNLNDEEYLKIAHTAFHVELDEYRTTVQLVRIIGRKKADVGI